MSSSTHTYRVGLFFIFGIALLWIVFETLSQSSFYRSKGYLLEAPFEDIKQLKVSDDVRLSGVRIGSVIKTELVGNRALAILSINEDLKIPRDSIAKISTAGLLGANYVAISPGESPHSLQEKEIILTEESGDLTSLMNSLGMAGKRLDRILASMDGSASESGKQSGTIGMLLHDVGLAQDIRNTFSNVSAFSAKLNDDRSTLGRLVTDDDLYQQASEALNRMQTAVSSFEDSGPITAVGVAASAIF